MRSLELDKEIIYRDYHGKVHGYIRSKIANPQDAEDLTSEVFVKIYANLDTFDEKKASLTTWIYTITRNTLTDFFRTRRVFEEIPETYSVDDSVEEELCSEEALEKLADALEKLEKRERDIILLHYYSGRSLKEIAEKLGISYTYVKVLQNKALAKLKDLL